MNIVDNIFEYVAYLKNNCNLNVSVHIIGYENLISDLRILTLGIHSNLYCKCVKSNTVAWKHCTDCQIKVLEKCKDGSFCGTCFAGVKEYVYPIENKVKIVGFVCVSGYKDSNYKSYVNKVSNKYNLNEETLLKAYGLFKDDLPDKREIDALINPLCCMLQLAYYKELPKPEISNNDKVLNYINQNHTCRITIDDISKKLYISRSTISHNFKKENGISINDYINNLRINDSVYLLCTTDLSITDIACTVGFGSVNRFINVFTKVKNISPKKYRNIYRLSIDNKLN